MHLRNLISNAFGKVFATSNVSIQFYTLNALEVCKVTIQKANKPLYLEVSDKNGQKVEKFYIRSGNSSQELGLSEISEYINTRFHNHT